MKKLKAWLFCALCGGSLLTLHSQPAPDVSQQVRVFSAPVETGPSAVVVTAKGKVEISPDGQNFAAIKPKQILTEGMTVKTGGDGQADIFFKRTGVALRLRENGQIKLTKMEHKATEGAMKPATELNLERGRALALTSGPLPGPFQITSAKGIKVAPTKVAGRNVISAGAPKGKKSINLASLPGTAQGSAAMRERGNGHNRSEDEVLGYFEIDELQSLADEWSHSEEPVKEK